MKRTLLPALFCIGLFSALPAISADTGVPASPKAGAAAVSSNANGTPAAVNGLVLVSYTTKASYDVSEPVKLDVVIRNTSAQPVSLGGSAFDLSAFRFTVLDPASQVASLTPFGKKLLAMPKHVYKNTAVTIKAGWQRRYQFDLTRMFDLSKPGMYSITLKRIVVNRRHAGATVATLAGDPIAITRTGAPKPVAVKPIVSAATKWTIAYTRDGDIWVANGAGNEQRLLIRNGEAPAWSPDKSLLAFARNGNVWVADSQGQNQRQLTHSQSLEAGVDPAFSPDGKWIAYRAFDESGGIEIRVVTVDGVTDKPFIESGEEPAW